MVHGYTEMWIMGLRMHGKMAIREYGYIGKWMSGHVVMAIQLHSCVDRGNSIQYIIYTIYAITLYIHNTICIYIYIYIYITKFYALLKSLILALKCDSRDILLSFSKRSDT